MDLTFLSFNIRGISSLVAQMQLCIYLLSLHFSILFLQEHKIWQEDWSFLGKRIWLGGSFFVAPAHDGTHADCNQSVPAGRGGLAIAVSLALLPFVLSHLILPCGGAILLHVEGLSMGPLSLLNLYGPNNSSTCTIFWQSLSVLTDPSWPWVIGGDFNMTTHAIHQLGGNSWDFSGQEAVSWDAFALYLALRDCQLALPLANQYSWDNRHTELTGSSPPQRTLKRLDHFYSLAALTAVHP